MSRALSFPAGTVAHVAAEADGGELSDLLALERAGVPLALFALPPAVEDSLYRYNNLPARLAALYGGVDPFDPDEDLLEEAEEEAMAVVDQAHLLDDVIDALYDAMAGMPDALVVRRPGTADGEPANGRRGALLALKVLVKRDWLAASVRGRLERHASVAVDAGPLLVHARGVAPDAELSRAAASLLGRQATVLAWRGGVTGVR